MRSRALFPDKKKVLYASKWLGRENAYDATRNADGPAKSLQVKINAMKDFFLPNFVFFKLNESEHSDSEFYYPGELSNAELLQLPTYSESTEGELTLLTNEEQNRSYAYWMSGVGPDG